MQLRMKRLYQEYFIQRIQNKAFGNMMKIKVIFAVNIIDKSILSRFPSFMEFPCMQHKHNTHEGWSYLINPFSLPWITSAFYRKSKSTNVTRYPWAFISQSAIIFQNTQARSNGQFLQVMIYLQILGECW